MSDELKARAIAACTENCTVFSFCSETNNITLAYFLFIFLALQTVKRFSKFKKGDPVVWGKASATVHASFEESLAWMWLYCSIHRMKGHQKKEGNIIRQIYEPPNKKANDEEQVITNKSERQAALSDET